MASYFRGAIALTFLAWTSVAGATDDVPSNLKMTSPSSKSQAQTGKQVLQLSAAQKETIFTLIRQTGVAVKPPPRNIRVVIGAQVPASTELYSLPHAAADKVPTARPYEYMIVNDTMVLVDPVSRKIVAIERQ